MYNNVIGVTIMRKMIQTNLVKNSISAFYSAVEIHNKPNISYRYETVIILLINSWELILKAYIRKYIKSDMIFEDSGKTISFSKCLDIVHQYINKQEGKKAFTSIKDNLFLLEVYRNNTVHFYNNQLSPIIFSLIAKCSVNYKNFIKKYFKPTLLNNQNLCILPIGFELPFKPIDFIKYSLSSSNLSVKSIEYANLVYSTICSLNDNGVEDSIILGFDIYLNNIKKIKNSDIIVAINNQADTKVKIAKNYKFAKFTNDSNAPQIKLDDSAILKNFPLSHKEVASRCYERYKEFKQNGIFHNRMRDIKKNPSLYYERKLDPKNKRSQGKGYYSEMVFDELDKYYDVI